jgi:hypothetical protein
LAQKHYNKSGYKDASGHSYYETMTDPGRKGEYLIYRYLEGLDGQHISRLAAETAVLEADDILR